MDYFAGRADLSLHRRRPRSLSGSTRRARSGRFPTSYFMRVSNFTAANDPCLLIRDLCYGT